MSLSCSPNRRVQVPLWTVSLIWLTCVVSGGVGPASGEPTSDPDASRSTEEILLDLAVWEDHREVPAAMLALTEHASPTVRGRLALALGRIGRSKDVPVAAALLADPIPSVRRWAAFGLGEMEDSTAAFPLEALLLSETEDDPEVRELAVEGLGKLGRGAEACRIALHDDSDAVQTEALFAAWKIPLTGAEEEILQFTGHKLGRVRAAATYCLMRLLGAPASGRTPIPGGIEINNEQRGRIEDRFLKLTRDSDVRVQLQAIRGLRRTFRPEVADRLIERCEHSDWRVRVEALRALATEPRPTDDESESESTGHSVDLTLILAAAGDSNPNVALTALAGLGSLGEDAEAEAALLTFLSDPRPRFRVVALETYLTRTESDSIPSPDFLGQLEILLQDKNWVVRAACVDAASRLGTEQRRTFLDHLARDEGRIAKLAVGPFLQELFDSGSGPRLARLEPDLTEFLDHRDPMVALMVIDKLGELFAPEDSLSAGADASEWQSLAELLSAVRKRALDQPDWTDTRQAIVGIAAEPGTAPAMQQILIASCEDPNFMVRRDAVAACRTVGIDPPREAGPVEGTYSRDEIAEILEWSHSDHLARIETSAGRIIVRLFTGDAPLTCWNFARLANDGFYDQGNWHRVVSNFVLQDGCPRGDGWGGPDDQIRCEINRRRYTRGALGMALAGKDTGGSQFFFTHSDQPHLNGGYTVFGEILSGQNAADQVVQGDPILTIRVIEG